MSPLLRSNIKQVQFWLREIAAPLLVLVFYCVLFGYYHSTINQLPDGVNLAFTRALLRTALILAGLALLAWLATRGWLPSQLGQPSAAWKARDWLLLLLPLTPVVQYLLSNREILSIADMSKLLLLFLLASATLVVFVPTLLARLTPATTLRSLGLVFAFMITNMAALSASFQWYAHGNLWVQFPIAFGLFALVWLLYNSKHRQLLYLLVIAYFLSNSVSQAFAAAPDSAPTQHPFEENALLAEIGNREPPSKPNIYLLIYDAYVANETMLGYGIDNSAQENYLRQQGFHLYPHTYSIGSDSVASMSTVLNVSTDFYGDLRLGTSGGGIVQTLLREYGYSTYGIFPSDYFFRGVGSSYDFFYPEKEPASALLRNGILLGEFRFDLGFGSGSDYVQRKLDLFENVPVDPFFVYSHSHYPGHSQNSGACLPDEVEQFQQRLQEGNQEMHADLETIAHNDPSAIVIVAGDHGPYLTKNCFVTELDYGIDEINRLDIQDRFGTFLAIRWPDTDYADYDEIVVLQDTFAAVFAYLFKDVGILEAARVPAQTLYDGNIISGAVVLDGIVHGGIDNMEPLFLSDD